MTTIGNRAGVHRVPPAQATLPTLQSDAAAFPCERVGPFDIRLATDDSMVEAAQRLRYQVFFEAGEVIADAAAARAQRDLCHFDSICDHLLVFDRAAPSACGRDAPRLVGTYRLLRRDVAVQHGGFYSQSEFDLTPLLARHPDARLLELGRACVHPDYRSKRVIEMLWRGLWLYARHHAVHALIGCASLPGTDAEANLLPLSLLHHHLRAEPSWQAAPLPHRDAKITPLSKDRIDLRRDSPSLPPLIKGYVRAGARFSPEAVFDRQFNTTDVFTVMPMAELDERYRIHYGQPSCLSKVSVA